MDNVERLVDCFKSESRQVCIRRKLLPYDFKKNLLKVTSEPCQTSKAEDLKANAGGER